jgi:hypothetical protein
VDFNKIEVCTDGKKFQLRFQIDDPVYGNIGLFSDVYSSIDEAEVRAFVLARALGLDHDHLPVHNRPLMYGRG